MILRFIIVISLILLQSITAQNRDSQRRSFWLYSDNAGSDGLYYVDLNGSNEYAYNSSPTDLDLNDTVRTLYDIDNDFEITAVYASDFSADENGWQGATATGLDSLDGNIDGVGGENDVLRATSDDQNTYHFFYLLADSSGTSAGNSYAITFKYYLPSGNTTITKLVLAYNDESPNAISSIESTQDSWTTVNVTWSSTSGSSGHLYVYGIDASDNYSFTGTAGDLFYIRDFDIYTYSNFAGTGNHSFDSTSIGAINGSYSVEIIATGSGDGSNQISLSTSYHTKVEAGKKYTFQLVSKSRSYEGGEQLWVDVGDQGKYFDLSETATTNVFNFEAGAGDTLIQIRCTDADTILIDDVDLSEAYDFTWSVWGKRSDSASYSAIIATSGSGNSNCAFHTSNQYARVEWDNSGEPPSYINLGSSSDISNGSWHLLSLVGDRDDSLKLYVDGVLHDGQNMAEHGAWRFGSHQLWIGRFWGGYGEWDIGEIQLINGTAQTTAQILANYNLGITGQHFSPNDNTVAWYKWAGKNDAIFLQDETGSNDLTGNNVTQAGDQGVVEAY